ncbi:MAG: HPP family protein [Candidatus Binatus sp.]|uniref:HPP family protein n=1 Tax=Candidatus Binatus sp. TaxID=2811406 RepID=UPI002719A813|nr:HPP family protein [Candidatus Binatus sp.]MDO8434845.1 HPP family protein [Candidatus Binatus sp.]
MIGAPDSDSYQRGWYELEPDREAGLSGGARIAADAIATIYIAAIAATATATGIYFIMFPELGALSYDVFGRPRGRWSNSPTYLALTPVITAILGVVVTRAMPYGVASVMITVIGALAIILAMRSPVAPAISAGLLPLVLGIKSWMYPPGILFGTTLLALMSIGWRRYHASPSDDVSREPQPDANPTGIAWLIALLTFVALAACVVRITGLRFILFPPLVVMAYEMFAHEASCAWADKPFRLPVAAFLASAGGFAFWHFFGATPLTAASAMICGIVVLRATRVHVPPALAVALLPMVMDAPTIAYPFAVGFGTLMLTLWFYLYRRVLGAIN